MNQDQLFGLLGYVLCGIVFLFTVSVRGAYRREYEPFVYVAASIIWPLSLVTIAGFWVGKWMREGE